MKADIHPDYHEIKVIMTDGTEYMTRMTWGKPGDVMRLDVDSKSHPAYTGGAQKVIERGQLSKFEKRFGNFLSSEAAAPAEKKASGKEETKQ